MGILAPRGTVLLEIGGQTRPLKEWCLLHGITYITAYRRMARGKTGADVLNVRKGLAKLTAEQGENIGIPWGTYKRLVAQAIRLETPTHQLALDCLEVCLTKLEKKESV